MLKTKLQYKIPLLVSLFALLPALRFGWGFTGDWRNQFWFITYYAEYFLRHFTFPDMFHSQQAIGMPAAIFYAAPFYKLMAIPAIILGTGIAFRLVILGVLLFQYYCIEKLFSELSGNQKLSRVIAIIWTLSIYPMTNLYNRSALMEFVAFALLTSSICLLCLITLQSEKYLRFSFMSLMGFCFTLAAGIHPITAVYGGTFAIVTFLTLLKLSKNRKKIFLALLPLVGLSLLCLAPWVYATANIYPQLAVAQKINSIDLFFDPAKLWWLRLLPFPFDPRMTYKETDPLPIHMDTQISVLLIVLLIYFIRRTHLKFGKNGILILVGCILFSVSYWLSISLTPWGYLPEIYKSAQLSYRLTAYCNLALLLALAGCFVGGGRLKVNFGSRGFKIITVGLLVSACFAHTLKIAHAFRAQESKEDKYTRFLSEKDGLLAYPPTLYSADSYVVTGLNEKMPVVNEVQKIQIPFLITTGKNFGKVDELNINLESEKFVLTNVQAFPWSQILLDGETTKLYEHDNKYALKIPAGAHTIAYQLKLPTVYSILSVISTMLYLLWFLVAIKPAFNLSRVRS
ncbi:MAG: hypothetical protein SGI74_00475 [Oligoflexia bacterium]|nr:hypothetical protein [Oligoflexia bacterium]